MGSNQKVKDKIKYILMKIERSLFFLISLNLFCVKKLGFCFILPFECFVFML